MDELTRKTLGRSLARLRSQAGFSQQQVAERLKVSKSFVSKWENGHRGPIPAQVLALARLYGAEPLLLQKRAGYLSLPGFDHVQEGDDLSTEQREIDRYLATANDSEKRMLVAALVAHRMSWGAAAEETG